jgi:CDP-glucose 4,6-dehydratase
MSNTFFASYHDTNVLLTGHTGFKGRWLKEKLEKYGAIVHGYSLPLDDVRNKLEIQKAVRFCRPHFVFHLAAQALVPQSFEEPLYTIETNVMGTANLLEALRLEGRPCAVVVVTSDKCYLPARDYHDHVEDDYLGGHDPYAASKASAEHVVEAYRTGFFKPDHKIAVATARAGNVIGGGDWAVGRLIPNAIRALVNNRPIKVWDATATRPWQYVEDVIEGYMLLGQGLASENRPSYCRPWNFGPDKSHTVKEVVDLVIDAWGTDSRGLCGMWVAESTKLRETHELRIDSTQARQVLDWRPRTSFEAAVRATVAWYKSNPPARDFEPLNYLVSSLPDEF